MALQGVLEETGKRVSPRHDQNNVNQRLKLDNYRNRQPYQWEMVVSMSWQHRHRQNALE